MGELFFWGLFSLCEWKVLPLMHAAGLHSLAYVSFGQAEKGDGLEEADG